MDNSRSTKTTSLRTSVHGRQVPSVMCFCVILSFNTRVSLIGPQQLLVRHVSSIYKLYVRCLQTLYIEPYVCCIAFARNQNKHHCATHGNRISYL